MARAIIWSHVSLIELLEQRGLIALYPGMSDRDCLDQLRQAQERSARRACVVSNKPPAYYAAPYMPKNQRKNQARSAHHQFPRLLSALTRVSAIGKAEGGGIMRLKRLPRAFCLTALLLASGCSELTTDYGVTAQQHESINGVVLFESPLPSKPTLSVAGDCRRPSRYDDRNRCHFLPRSLRR